MEKRFGVVSADGHCRLMHLPFDLWTKRLSRKFQDDAPRVVTGPDGTRQWVVEGHPWSGVGWAGVNAPEPVLHQMWEPVWAAAAETRTGQSARQPERRVAPDGSRGHGPRATQPGSDAGRQLPDGSDGRTDECRRLLGHL